MKEKKKVLFVINSLVGGGAERVFVDLIKNLDKNKFDITVLSIDDWGLYRNEIKKYCKYRSIIKHATSPLFLKWFYGGMSMVWEKIIKYFPAKLLHRWFVKEKYDIEVAYIEGMANKVVSGCDDKEVTKYSWIHTDMITNPWSEKYYKNAKEEFECYQKIEYVIAVSEDVKKAAEKKFDIAVVVKYNALDDKYIRKVIKNENRILKKKAKLSLISIGTLWEMKGYLRLIKVVEELVNEGYDIELHLIGDGEERREIENYIEEYSLNEYVYLYGFQKEPYDLLEQGDLYVCSSYAEGFSTCVTEALILGVPVLTTNCSGMKELLGDSEYGVIVDNDDNGLKEGIKRFADNPELLERYQKKAIERGQCFRVENTIRELEHMFLEGK